MIAYLDNAATTPVSPEAAQAACNAMTTDFGNPSTQYPLGKAAKKALDGHRKAVADALGCKPAEVVFTSCGTESDNWALRLGAQKNRRKGRHIITTAFEPSAILQTCHEMEAEGWEVTYLMPNRQGQISLDDLKAALRPDTVLVSMLLVNNETGCVFPAADIAALLREKGSPALLHCDAVQGFLKVPCDPEGWGVDLMSLSGHKVGGPKGVGALYIGPRVRNPRPLLPGGGQERGARSGTEATAQIAGFAKAVELRLADYDAKLAHMAGLKAYCREKLLAMGGVVPVGEGTAPHILAVSLVGYPSANIVTDLGAQGICISAGSACHQGKASHVVSALGLDKKTAAGVIRISFSPDNTEADVDALCHALKSHRDSRFPML